MTAFRHKKRGTDYETVGIAELQSAEKIGDGEILTVYCDSEGRLWARPHQEFNDGRFVPHDSDCALHNEPALPKGKCDCTLSQ